MRVPPVDACFSFFFLSPFVSLVYSVLCIYVEAGRASIASREPDTGGLFVVVLTIDERAWRVLQTYNYLLYAVCATAMCLLRRRGRGVGRCVNCCVLFAVRRYTVIV